MILQELKDIIDWIHSKETKDNNVLITLSQPSVAGRACVGIRDITPGIDWESGQIRISTDKPIILKEKDRDTPMNIICYAYENGDRRRLVRCCPVCENHLHKEDRYCSRCGQAVDMATGETYIH